MLWFYCVFFTIKNVLLCRVAGLNSRKHDKKTFWLSVGVLCMTQLIGVLVILFIHAFMTNWLSFPEINGALNASLFRDGYVVLPGVLTAIVLNFAGLFVVLRKSDNFKAARLVLLSLLGAPYLLLLPMVSMCEVIVGLSVIALLVFIVPYYLFGLFSRLVYSRKKKSVSLEMAPYQAKAVANAFIAEIAGIVAIIMAALLFKFPTDDFAENLLCAFSFGYMEHHCFAIPFIGLLIAVLFNFCLLAFVEFKVYKIENKTYMTDVLLLTICNAPYVFLIPIINIIAVCLNLISWS